MINFAEAIATLVDHIVRPKQAALGALGFADVAAGDIDMSQG
jgi:hypothetical protein